MFFHVATPTKPDNFECFSVVGMVSFDSPSRFTFCAAFGFSY